MPRPQTNPLTTNYALKLEIAALRKWGYMQVGYHAFTFRLGRYTEEIRAELEMSVRNGGYLRLSYVVVGQLVDCLIEIVPVPSNLGRGIYYHFRCPVSGSSGKTLYRPTHSLYFAHRTALGVKYASQYEWGAFKGVARIFKLERRLEVALTRPHRKEFYAGNATRWYQAAVRDLSKQKQLFLQLNTQERARQQRQEQAVELWKKYFG